MVMLGLALLGVVGAAAEVRLTDPGLGPETLTYVETIGTLSRPYRVVLSRAGEGAALRWELRTSGADVDSVYRFDPVSLLSLSSETLTRTPDAWVKRTGEYQNLSPRPAADEVVVTDLGSLPLALRGFPFGKVGAARLLYVGNLTYGGTGVSFELQVVGRESVKAAGRSWDCWRLSLGLGGGLSLVLPKTDLWFAVEGSHPLVKSSGPAGGPGSPTRTLLLERYARD